MADFHDLYAKKRSAHLYPTEFVIRAFLGSYPNLKMDKSLYPGKRVLDLGYGDGRNMPLLDNLGFEIHGVETDDRINQLTAERMQEIGIKTELRKGTNRTIPYEDKFFDYLLACHACYYVEEGTSFADNVNEMARVMRPGGFIICSLPMPDTYILKDAKLHSPGHWRIAKDPFGLRDGALFRAFADESDVEKSFSPHFTNFAIGFCDDMYWGIHQKLWIVVAQKA